MGVLHTIALVANTTSRILFATGEWRGHFKNVGMYSRRIAYRDSCYMNKQVSRILEIRSAIYVFYSEKGGGGGGELSFRFSVLLHHGLSCVLQ